MADRGADGLQIFVQIVALAGAGVVEGDAAMQIVVAGQAVVVPPRMPDGGDARRFGKVAEGGEMGVLAAQEAHHNFRRLMRSLVYRLLPGQGVQDAGQRHRGKQCAGRRVGQCRLLQACGEVRQDAGAQQQPERNDDEYIAIFLVRLQRVGEQHQADEQQQKPVAARLAQRQRHAECAAAGAGEEQPPKVLMGRAGAGRVGLPKLQVEADVGEVGVEEPAIPAGRIERPDRQEKSRRRQSEMYSGHLVHV